MDWAQLLNANRPSKGKFEENEELDLSPFERDYYTIIGNSYFRRLQNKTQVYTLDTSDFIRTRLTHSMEVSCLAEIMGRRLGERIVAERNEELPENFIENLAMVLRCSGLLHDLGNPPFGHSGEEYIRDYFEANEDKLRENLTDQMWYDFINFEGNAHNIRIVTKLGQSSNPEAKNFGMDLTNAVINSIIKYPYNSLVYKDREPNSEGKRKRGKIGFYHSEEWILTRPDRVMRSTGTLTDDRVFKNPIMMIMEAADDIAYATADVEDAIKKKQIQISSFFETLPEEEQDNLHKKFRNVQRLVKKIRERSMVDVVDTFINNYDQIMSGEVDDEFELIDGCYYDLKNMKNLLINVYGRRDNESEYRYNTKNNLHRVLDTLINISRKEESERTINEIIILNEIKQYTKKGESEVYNANKFYDFSPDDYKREVLYHKYMAVVDFVSGMTDSYVKVFLDRINDELFFENRIDDYKKDLITKLLNSKNNDFEDDYVVYKMNVLINHIGNIHSYTNLEISILLNAFLNIDFVRENMSYRTLFKELFSNYDLEKETILSSEDYEKLKELL